MKSCCEDSRTISSFLIGGSLGLGLGLILGCNCPSRRSMRKMAKRTAFTVSEAMDHLRESLHQYL
ncbi:MAG: hypothetical protein R3Y63_01575 [Eubacteriales bacterium]